MFQPLSNLPIRTKIFVSSVLTLILICTFIFIYYPSQQKRQMFQAMEEKNHAVAEMIAFGVGFGMASGDFEAVTQALDWARHDRSLAYLVVVDEDGQVFASYNPSQTALDIPLLLNQVGIIEIDGYSLHAISSPIQYRGISSGTLLLGSSLESLNRDVEENAKTTLLVSLIILLFGIGSSMFFGQIITKPLKELSDAAKEISRGNHDVEIPVTTTDEVGTLGMVLKDMIGNILKTLRESEEKFRSMSSSAQDAIIMIDNRGLISYWNAAAERTLGYSSEEALGINLHKIIAPAGYYGRAKKGFSEFSQASIEPLIGRITEITAVRKNGTEFPAELSISSIRLANSWHAVGIMRDVTELRRSEAELKHLGMAINQTSETVVITDAQGFISYANPSFEKTTGYSVEEAIGQNPRLLSSGQHDSAFYKQLWDTIANGRTWSGRFVNRKKDGSLYTEEATISPIFSEAGNIVSYVAVKRDITDEIQRDIRHQELQEKFDRAEKMESLGILAGGVAHDLNNMLGPVVGYSELILRNIPKENKLSQQVNRIFKSAKDAADVIQDLLTLARRGRYEMSPIDINEVIDSYIDSPIHQKLVESRPEIDFQFNLDRSIARINGSPPHLSKVIMNLVVNACDAMLDGGSLTVTTSQQHLESLKDGHKPINPGNYIVLSTTDTGMGIDPKDINKIFEPYYSKKKMGASGSGLGLSVVYGVVKDHKGYYDIYSELEKGTEFVLYFPITTEKAANESTDKADIRGSQSVLIVDDVKEQREVTADILSSLGYQISIATTGQEAVKYVRNQPVDILVLDMILDPGYDGLDTYQDIIELNPDQKAIIVSGFSATKRIREMQSLGAGEFIRKPFTVEILGAAIRRELDRQAEKVT